MKGLGAEICKNLVLSGVKSVTIVDPSPVNEQDFVSQFLVQRQDLGKNVSHIIRHMYSVCETIKNNQQWLKLYNLHNSIAIVINEMLDQFDTYVANYIYVL